MAKDLPYFKFFCSEWNDGDITLEDYKIQGLFINVCSYYWSNECNVTLKTLKKKFRDNSDTIDYLIKEGLIKNFDEFISISFLDEQCKDRGKLSNQNSINAKKRWDKLREIKESDAVALIPQSESGTESMQYREEEKRKEEKREEKINKAKPKNLEEVEIYFKEQKIMHYKENASKFFNHYEANGWMRTKTKIKNWKACVKTWNLPRLGITDEDVQKMNPTDRANHLSKILLGGNNG